MFNSVFGRVTTFSVIALILSIVAVVLAFIFIVPEKKRAKLNKFGQFLHDTFNFKYLIVEKILQALYIFLTAYVFILGFLMLFYVQESYYGSGRWMGGYGILVMILGPIAVRLIYELLMMAVLVVKNVISINNKLKGQNDGNDPFATPDLSGIKNAFQQQDNGAQQTYYQPQEQTTPNYVYCPNCGSVVQEGTFCPKCGTKV